MEYDPEFPVPTRRENEAVVDYMNREKQFMAMENFYDNLRNQQIRKSAIHTISTCSSGVDPFVPYLAMNYFDRFVSRHNVSDFEGNEGANIRQIAISCLTISFKTRRKSADVLNIMHMRGFQIPMLKILVTELHILTGLEWRIRSITPFCFLEYYYPKFEQLGGFRRNSINEIIVQSQADYRFTRFKPSDIAFSSLVAAASILYPDRYENILNEERAHISQERDECLKMMIEFCEKMAFRIEPAESVVVTGPSSSSAGPTHVEIPTETEEADNRGKAIKQSSGEEDRTPALSASSDTTGESFMAVAEVERIPSAENKEVTLAGGIATTSAAKELTNKLMTFELRWIEIVGPDQTIDPLTPVTDDSSPVNGGCSCNQCNPLQYCNIL